MIALAALVNFPLNHAFTTRSASGRSSASMGVRLSPRSKPSAVILRNRISFLCRARRLSKNKMLVFTPEYGLNTPAGSETTAISESSTRNRRSFT